MSPVLVTRAEPGASLTVARLRALKHEPINAATAQIVQRHVALDLGQGEALALTSPNGARSAASLLQERTATVFTVGDATADAARREGFARIVSASGDGAALAALIATRWSGPVLHVRGEDQSFDLAGALKQAGLPARDVVAYAAEPVEALSAEAIDALQDDAAILIHSPLGANRFIALARKAGLEDALVQARWAVISTAAAAPVRSVGAQRVNIADRPDEPALLDALARALR